MLSTRSVTAALVLALAPAAARAQTCQPSWLPTFGAEPGVDDQVCASAVFDDGSGPALYVGGVFTSAQGAPANHIARWDGTSWSALGSGTNDDVLDLAVHDDGSGAALYAVGRFTTAGGVSANRVAKWDGTSWSALGAGLNHRAWAVAAYDDGTGAALYVTGEFTAAGGAAAKRIAKWDGTGWSPLGGGLRAGGGFALEVFDDGSGSELFVAGTFDSANKVQAAGIAKWNGARFAPLGSGLVGVPASLASYDSGAGPELYVSGWINGAGGSFVDSIAKWNGSSWSSVGGGIGGPAMDLYAHDDGNGERLYAGGYFSPQSSGFAYVAAWDGTTWSGVGSGTDYRIETFVEYDDGVSGNALYVGGWFDYASGTQARHIARWDGEFWSAVGSGLDSVVSDLATFDDGHGEALYIGGAFRSIDSTVVNYVARWDGSQVTPLGSGMDTASVEALLVHDDGSGPALFAGGRFGSAGGVASNCIAKWDGTSWSGLAGGMSIPNTWVYALAEFDDGTGNALYAGGRFFDTASGVKAPKVAKWDGAAWSPLGKGLDDFVDALAVFDDGTGPALYAGGFFTKSGTQNLRYIARWDGSAWSSLGSGMNVGVRALAVWDDGNGPALYAGGSFTTASGVPAEKIARWDGSTWSPLGAGVQFTVYELFVHDDGSGEQLYAAGNLGSAGGTTTNGVARWDGTTWTTLGNGLGSINDRVVALASYDDGAGSPTLYAGGQFDTSSTGDAYLARWGGCPDYEVYCTAGFSASGCQASISATGAASATAGSGFELHISGVEGAKDGLFFYGTNGRQANPWGSGTSFVCVIPPRWRGGLLAGSGTNGACDGSFSQDLNARWCPTCPNPAHNPGAGALVQAQMWYRDPQNTSNQTSSMSDAIEFPVGP